MSYVIGLIGGAFIGGMIGAVIGYTFKGGEGACESTWGGSVSPWSGIIIFAFLGAIIGASIGG